MEIIINAIDATLATKGEDYFARPAGSGIENLEGSVPSFLSSLQWEENTEEVKAKGGAARNCRYFQAFIPEAVVAAENVALLGEIPDELLSQVRVRRGHHGNIEHYLPGMEPRRTNKVQMIICARSATSWPPRWEATARDCQVVTWYPGRVTPFVETGDITVKG
jgi:hypothetical protein